MPKVPFETLKEFKVLVNVAMQEYIAEAEEHEDDDIILETSAEGRLNDFAMWLFHCRFKTI